MTRAAAVHRQAINVSSWHGTQPLAHDTGENYGVLLARVPRRQYTSTQLCIFRQSNKVKDTRSSKWYSRDRATGRHLPYGITQCNLLYPTQVNAPRPQAGTRFNYHGGMEGRVDLGYPAVERPGVELATSRSQVRRPNHYTTEPPILLLLSLRIE